MLSKENYDIVLATSTAALPAWMVKKYPEVMSTDYEGRHHTFGGRHNACPNSLVYQKYARALAFKLAERYGKNEHVTAGTSTMSTVRNATATTARKLSVYGFRTNTIP